jgi:undecaprenyl-diphosphatase
MHIFHALILGVVEGITEFLPVSSTGHLIMAARVLKIPQSDFIKSFEIIIQLGAILAVVCLYFRSLFLDVRVMKKVLAAFIPTGVLGFLFYKLAKKYLLGNGHVVAWSLLIGGIFLVVFELLHREKEGSTEEVASISIRQAVLIGVFQSLAIIPGVSRSAATIIGGLLLGLKRKTIVEFSFLLAIPTMLAATVLDLSKSGFSFSGAQISFLAVGFITSFLVALAAVKLFISYIQKNNFIAFGVYRIVIAALFLIIAFLMRG